MLRTGRERKPSGGGPVLLARTAFRLTGKELLCDELAGDGDEHEEAPEGHGESGHNGRDKALDETLHFSRQPQPAAATVAAANVATVAAEAKETPGHPRKDWREGVENP